MIEKIISQIQPIVVQYGARGVFLGVLLEEIIAPIPSPLVPTMAGFFLLPACGSLIEVVWQGILIIALPVTLGVTLGSLAVYSLGYFGGKPMIDKSKKWTGLSWKDVEKIENKLTRGYGDEIVLFILRIVPVIPGVAISGFCGMTRYSLKSFAIVTVLGSFVRALALSILGWYVGEKYAVYVEIISGIEKYIFIIVITFAALLLGRLYITKKRSRRTRSKGKK